MGLQRARSRARWRAAPSESTKRDKRTSVCLIGNKTKRCLSSSSNGSGSISPRSSRFLNSLANSSDLFSTAIDSIIKPSSRKSTESIDSQLVDRDRSTSVVILRFSDRFGHSNPLPTFFNKALSMALQFTLLDSCTNTYHPVVVFMKRWRNAESTRGQIREGEASKKVGFKKITETTTKHANHAET